MNIYGAEDSAEVISEAIRVAYQNSCSVKERKGNRDFSWWNGPVELNLKLLEQRTMAIGRDIHQSSFYTLKKSEGFKTSVKKYIV